MLKKIIPALLVLTFITTQASAHFLWVNAKDLTPSANRNLKFSIGWGHGFYNPVGSILLNGEKIKEFYMLTSQGKKVQLKGINPLQFKTESKIPQGTHLVVISRNEDFYTKYKSKNKTKKAHASKKGLKNVIESRFIGMYAKAIVNSGKAKQSEKPSRVLGKKVGHRLEIVPLSDPAKLKAGDYFEFRVLFNGEPLGEAFNSTYLGFSQDEAWAYSARSNSRGLAKVRLLKPGIWVIRVNHKEKYPDPKVSDIYSLTASLVFEIK